MGLLSVTRVSAPRILSDLVKFEVDTSYVREFGTLTANNPVVIGTPLGKISAGAVTTAAKAGGNTGNGVLTLDPTTPKLVGARPGVYTVRFIAAATNGGTFRVEDPNGDVIGDGQVGAAFVDDVKFTIADGATDFVVGDGFDITIAAGSGKIVVLSATGLDGSSKCIGFSFVNRDPGNADQLKGVTYGARGPLVVADAGIVWPAGFTADQKLAAIADVTALGIVVRPAF